MERTIPNNKTVAEESEGSIGISVISQREDVVVNFGKQLSWIGLKPQHAVDFASLIIKHALDTAALTGIELSLTLDARIELRPAAAPDIAPPPGIVQ